jgi:MYXO-CTERM domain-containing protein
MIVLLDGAADRNADTAAAISDAAPVAEPGPDAAIVKDDAAATVGNKDAAATEQKPVLLGGGFCAVSSSRTSSPAAFALLGLAALAFIRRRRSR